MNKLRKEYDLHKERRRRHIEKLIEESVINVLVEQEQAQQTPPSVEAPPPPVATPDSQEQASVPKQYTVDNMIEELNAIRGGRSFTDPEVYGRLVTFFKNLGEEQKSSLDTLLTQIAELVTSVDDSAQGQQGQQSQPGQPPPPTGEAPQKSAPMPGAQPAAGAAGVGVA